MEIRAPSLVAATVQVVGQRRGELYRACCCSVQLRSAGERNGARTVTQSPETIEGIWALATLIPAVFLAGTALCLLFWYPLKKKQVLENTALLHAQREAAKVA